MIEIFIITYGGQLCFSLFYCNRINCLQGHYLAYNVRLREGVDLGCDSSICYQIQVGGTRF